MKRFLYYAASMFAAMQTISAQQFQPSAPQPQGVKNPVKWEISAQQTTKNSAELYFHAIVDSGWKVYAPHIATELPLPLAVVLNDGSGHAQEIVELTTATEKYDSLFEENVRYFTKEFRLKMAVLLDGSITKISGSVDYKACNMTTQACVQPSYDFETAVSVGESTEKIVAATSGTKNDGDSLWLFFLLAMAAGFAGVLTPCVFPMLPMNVSFFMRQASRRMARLQLSVFALSIVLIYTLIGIIAALSKNASFVSTMSVHWLPNLLFFVLFLTFAASFFGAFNIVLPQSITTKADRRADSGGILGAFFMALTLCIVSFSCTAPFVGALLVAAAEGAVLKPFVGMLGFGIAFALPFTLLGLFPAAMKKLPKSGGWMDTVKVTFAFLLIMFGMKYLSAADVDLQLFLIPREFVVSVWIACLLLWGFYILGRLPLLHDNKKIVPSAARIFAAILAFAAAVYMLTSFVGGKLSWVEGFLPEKTILQQTKNNSSTATKNGGGLCGEVRFAEITTLSAPIDGAYYDLKQAETCAALTNRPLLLYFKGHSCANCKQMQNSVLKNVKVLQLLQDKFVVVALYTDDKTTLPEAEWYISAFDGKTKKTIGQQNLDYLITNFSVNTIPFFVVKTGDSTTTIGYTASTDEFVNFLEQK